MTLEIIEEIGKLGINVIPTNSWQESLFPLLGSFYETFKDNLKELYISGDLIGFINKIGNKEFGEYSQFVFRKIFRIKRKLNNNEKVEITEQDILIAEQYVDYMNTNLPDKKQFKA